MDRQKLREAKARAHAGMKALLDAAANEERGLTVEEKAQYDAHKAEHAKSVDMLAMLDETEAIGADLSTPRPSAATRVPQMAAPVVAEPARKEFESVAEFVAAAAFNPNDQRLDYGAMNMGTGSAGGFAVPKQFLGELLRTDPAAIAIRSRARVIPAGDPPDSAIEMPALDQGTGSNLYGGVTVDWIAEGAEKPATDVKMKQVTLTPQEVAAHIPITDKLLRNWAAAGAVVAELLRGAIQGAEEAAFLTGNGTGKPTGILAAANAALIKVKRAVALKVAYADLVNLEAKFKGVNGFYIVSRAVLPQLMMMTDTAGNLIWANAVEGKPPRLLGRDVVISDYTPALGVMGDVQLVDASYYLIKDGSGPFVAASEHQLFTQNKTIVKAFWNVDGKAWPSTPFVLPGGATASPFVALDVP